MVHTYLMGPNSKSIIQQKTHGYIVLKDLSISWTTMINPDTGWFEIIYFPSFDLEEVTSCNNGYIYK